MTDYAADFDVTDHGTVWIIRAVSTKAVRFARNKLHVEGWMSVPENFATDWRPAANLVDQLIAEGWNVTGIAGKGTGRCTEC